MPTQCREWLLDQAGATRFDSSGPTQNERPDHARQGLTQSRVAGFGQVDAIDAVGLDDAAGIEEPVAILRSDLGNRLTPASGPLTR